MNEEYTRLLVHDVEFLGKGVARNNGKVIFVEGALPGEIVDAQEFQRKKGFSVARITTFHKSAPERVVPFCPHFIDCGGCTWQHVTYEKQLEFKRKFVEETFQRIGKFPFPVVPSVLPCDRKTFYRNKLEFTFSNKRWLTSQEMEQRQKFTPALGYHKSGAFDKVLDIQQCFLQPAPSNEIRNGLRTFALDENLSFFDLRKQEGFLRNLIIRTSSLDELLVLVSFFYDEQNLIQKVMEFLQKNFPQITSLNYVINDRANDALTDHEVITWSGNNFIREKLGELIFHIGAKSFFQVNVQQAEKLFQTALEFAELRKGDIVYDLYCGAGSISLFIAKFCKSVIGVEQSEDAIADAQTNAALNKISNCTFIAGDAGKILNEDFLQQHGSPQVIFIDPPRAGMHPQVVKALLEISAPRIVYVSCNPATQARDIALLIEKYSVKKIHPVDMFPHTYHIENVVMLELKQ